MIPLIVRSYYSLMWGTPAPEKICTAAKQRGYKRLALTDTDNLYGLWPFLKACRRSGIAPIIGAELTDPASNHRAVCLIENDEGYRNLCRLITRRHTDKKFDLKSAVPAHAAGAVAVTATNSIGSDTLDDAFTYVDPPTVASVTPNTGRGDVQVTITGTNFTDTADTTVTVGGASTTNLTVVSATELTCELPPCGAAQDEWLEVHMLSTEADSASDLRRLERVVTRVFVTEGDIT